MKGIIVFFIALFIMGIWTKWRNTIYIRKMRAELEAKKAEQDRQWRAMSYAERKKMMAIGSAMFNGPFEEKS